MANNFLKMSERIEEIKSQLGKMKNFRAGSLSEQYNVCGKAGCQCKDEKKSQKARCDGNLFNMLAQKSRQIDQS